MSADGPASAADGVRTEEVEYLRLAGEALAATLYLPDGRHPAAGVVEVHGGAWTGGERTSNAFLDAALARRGIAVMAIDFRRPPEGCYPAPVADINYALRYFKANAARWSVPPERIGAVGTSSGGHQLMLATMRHDDVRYRAHESPPEWGAPGPDAAVSFAVLCWPVTDPVARLAMARAEGIERLVDSHAAYWPSEADTAEGSPQAILERREDVHLPPTLVIQGTKDENLTPDMADRFAAAYAAAGGKLTLLKYEGEPHLFINVDPTSVASQAAIEAIAGFILDR